MPTFTSARNSFGPLAASLCALLLSGCAFSGSTGSRTTASPTASTTGVRGTVFGGQQPVSGALLQLYTVGTTGNGSASTALITGPTVLSQPDGGFTITGTYTCAAATQTYITATGGNAGAGTNAQLAMMAALGPCSALLANTNTNIVINELTTVAAVYALSPFMSDFTHIGTQGTNTSGLLNAFASATALVNTSNGALAAAATGITLPVARLNTLANILAACINTAGSSSPQCTSLLGATGASNTIDAGLAIAKSPGTAAYTALYSLGSATPPFVPALSAQPNDFTLAVNYRGAELVTPFGIAVDATGNAFITNEAGRSIIKAQPLSPAFATTTLASAGILAPRGISIDRSGNIWLANTGANNVLKLSAAGAILGTFAAGTAPVAIANDSAGNAWVASFNSSSITELNSTGTASAASPITNASLVAPTSIALDSAGNVAVANAGNGQLCILSNAGVVQNCPGDGSLLGATAVAVSSTGTVALAGNTTGNAVTGAFTLATTAPVINGASPVSGGGLTLPVAVAYDGSGKAWFANTASLSVFSAATAISPTTGLGSLSAPAGIAIDASGNVWTANSGDNSLSIFIGAASAVATPLAANVGP